MDAVVCSSRLYYLIKLCAARQAICLAFLTWVVSRPNSTTEQKFLEASLAYQAGKPMVSDEEYDQLKAQLRKKNSVVVQQVLAATLAA